LSIQASSRRISPGKKGIRGQSTSSPASCMGAKEVGVGAAVGRDGGAACGAEVALRVVSLAVGSNTAPPLTARWLGFWAEAVLNGTAATLAWMAAALAGTAVALGRDSGGVWRGKQPQRCPWR
jgi:hypothetical protein